ncbi:MAG TPA: hypothetical protein VNG93_06030 [Candidatus Dormibacteraeota bacterium]|nr:hypothetical protein [Candidatus Dormibacteraeota bacterium]
MNNAPQPPRRRHRAVILILMMLLGVAFVVFTFPGPADLNGRSLIALGVAVAVAAIGGIAFSWARYFPRR